MKLIFQGNQGYVTEDDFVSVYDELPKGIYTICQSRQGLYLNKEEITRFDVIEKTYGKLPLLRKKLNNDIRIHDKLGMMFVGEKGSGKSLLAMQLCNDSNLPIVIVKENFEDSDICGFLDSIPNKYILFIDEFEKIFDKDKKKNTDKSTVNTQNSLLSLFDGIGKGKIISILTANKEDEISEYFRNRPKRIKYFIEFNSLSKEEILEFVEDKSLDISVKHKLMNLEMIVNSLNYDILTEIVNELLTYPEYSISDLLYYMNIKISEVFYDIVCYCNTLKGYEGQYIKIGKDNGTCNPFLSFYCDIYPTDLSEEAITVKEGDSNYSTNIEHRFLMGKDYSVISRGNDSLVVILDEDYVDMSFNFGKLKFEFTKPLTKMKHLQFDKNFDVE